MGQQGPPGSGAGISPGPLAPMPAWRHTSFWKLPGFLPAGGAGCSVATAPRNHPVTQGKDNSCRVTGCPHRPSAAGCSANWEQPQHPAGVPGGPQPRSSPTHPPALAPGVPWGRELRCPPGRPTGSRHRQDARGLPSRGISSEDFPALAHPCSAPSPGWGPGQQPARGTQEGAGTPETLPAQGHEHPQRPQRLRAALAPAPRPKSAQWLHPGTTAPGTAPRCSPCGSRERGQAGLRLPGTCHTGHPPRAVTCPGGTGDRQGLDRGGWMEGGGAAGSWPWPVGQGSGCAALWCVLGLCQGLCRCRAVHRHPWCGGSCGAGVTLHLGVPSAGDGAM